MTIKSPYLFPLIDEILNPLSDAQVFTKMNLKNNYYRLRIRKDDEWKTAFRTRYRLFEYSVMLFRLTNPLASIQSYIHRVLRPYLDITVIVYLNDACVFLRDLFQHKKPVRKLLKAFLKADCMQN